MTASSGSSTQPTTQTGSPADDPGAYTVADVLAYVDANPDKLDLVYAAEQMGKARVTLLSELESRGAGA